MNDTNLPTVSEIQKWESFVNDPDFWTADDLPDHKRIIRRELVERGIPYLLGLVKRMGDELEQHADHSEFCGSSENPGHKEARALVEESKK